MRSLVRHTWKTIPLSYSSMLTMKIELDGSESELLKLLIGFV